MYAKHMNKAPVFKQYRTAVVDVRHVEWFIIRYHVVISFLQYYPTAIASD
jgi:hypothetical protein